MTRDQKLVQQIQHRLPNFDYDGPYFDPDWPCRMHPWVEKRCRYDQRGHLLELHLCELRLSQVPSQVWRFSALQELYLSYNQLRTLPAEIGKLSALQRLDLFYNDLSVLPAELGNLSTLQELDLGENQLTILPAELGNLSKLSSLSLLRNRNPLQTPPPEIVAQGTDAILFYLRTLLQARVERFEAKVILVGEGGMGKTSLLRALQQQPFVEGLPPTHGIEVGTLPVPHPARRGVVITLYTWDFGGQEIYQATHQFFLTQRSVYLLVWNARLGVEACRLPFWLETISAHAPDAKVLLIATHRDLWQTPAINLPAYQQHYPQIVGLCSISNKTWDGLDDLKGQIAAAAVVTPFVGQQWPKSWVEAEQSLLARPEHHLDQADFLVACRQHKIMDEMERETFGRYLHDLGKILYFHDDPMLRTLVVLKPNWITKAISRALTDPQVQQAGGVLDYRELPRIWATDEEGNPYPPALYPIFVRMMERFQLCYQLEPERPGQPVSQSLIPQLLPHQPPATLLPIPTVPETGHMRLEMRYTLSFVPAGLISWLLVRTHRYSQRQHWREGAHLAYAGQQAQVALDSQQREITITVWGPFPYTFLLILKQTLDELLQTFQGLHVQRSIPCRCAMQPQAPHYHNYEGLERRLARGESEITCQEGVRLSLTTLLYGLHASTVPQMVATVQETQQAMTRQLAPNQPLKQSQMPTEELRQMLVRLNQGQEYLYRFQLHLERQKLSNPCPGLFVLERPSSNPLNPRDWVGRAYRLHLLCQYPQGPHPVLDQPGYEVRQGKEWWNAMSPWLRRMVKLLEVGLPLGKAINEGWKLMDIERFVPEIEVFQEILTDLPEIEASDDLSQAHLGAQAQTLQRLEGGALEALHTFLNGHPRPWQGLTQVIADDGTLLWVCDQHRKEFEPGLITVR